MRFLRALSICVWLGFIAQAFALPEMLIVKVSPEVSQKVEDADPENNLVNFVAQEFDSDGRVHSIAYTLTDPYFRTAVDEGLIRIDSKGTNLKEALAAARNLKVDYLLAVSVWQGNGGMMAVATLYSGGNSIWRDPPENDPGYLAALNSERNAERLANRHNQKISEVEIVNARQIVIGNTGEDRDNAFASLAHTWANLLETGPLSRLPAHPTGQAVKISRGQQPPVVPPPPPPKTNDGDVVGSALKLLASHQYDQAIEALRDAVDAQPLDPSRRRALVDALADTGQMALAAKEAHLAAELMPDQPQFRLLAARCDLAQGQMDEAMAELKYVVARDPNGPETRLLLGEVDLYKLHFEDAQTQFDYAVSNDPTGQAYFDRALLECVKGDAAGMARDFGQAKELGYVGKPATDSLRYPEIERVFEQSEQDLGPRSREVLRRARLNSSDSDVASELQTLYAKVGAEITFLGLVEAPPGHQHSCELRLLALNLLTQTYADLLDWIKTPNDDLMSDATIDLGEGLRDLDAAAPAYEEEMRKG